MRNREANTLRMREWRAKNPERAKENARRYRQAHLEEIKARRRGSVRAAEAHRVRTYGLTPTQYAAMLEQQSGSCAICGKPETMVRRGGVAPLAVDHDHATGRVRGLLCEGCNSGLGRFGDDPELVRRALAYLESAK